MSRLCHSLCQLLHRVGLCHYRHLHRIPAVGTIDWHNRNRLIKTMQNLIFCGVFEILKNWRLCQLLHRVKIVPHRAITGIPPGKAHRTIITVPTLLISRTAFQNVFTHFFGTDFTDQTRLNEGLDQIHGALFRNPQRLPNFTGR